MKNEDTITLRMWQVKNIDKAYLFSTVPFDKDREGDQHWIPKTQIEHISRKLEGTWPECEVTMTLWIAQQKGLA